MKKRATSSRNTGSGDSRGSEGEEPVANRANPGNQHGDTDGGRTGERGRQGQRPVDRREFIIRSGKIVVVAEFVSLLPFLSACSPGGGQPNVAESAPEDPFCCQVETAPRCDDIFSSDCTECTDCTDDCTSGCTDDCTSGCTDYCTDDCTSDCTDYCTDCTDCTDCTGCTDCTDGTDDCTEHCTTWVCAQCEICLDGCQNVATGAW
jgi:hypothetical protein